MNVYRVEMLVKKDAIFANEAHENALHTSLSVNVSDESMMGALLTAQACHPEYEVTEVAVMCRIDIAADTVRQQKSDSIWEKYQPGGEKDGDMAQQMIEEGRVVL